MNLFDDTAHIGWVHPGFLALPPEQSALETARVALVPAPYDGSASFRTGARYGPARLIAASAELEDYDLELDANIADLGFYTTPAVEPVANGPGYMAEQVRLAVKRHMGNGRLVGILGGDHSVAAGGVRAQVEAHPEMSVLYLDAHADLRDRYQDTPWGHASTARRMLSYCPVVLVGIRSLCQEEMDFIRARDIPTWYQPLPGDPLPVNDIVDALNDEVYISIDLDVLDPALMPAVGTPEPGGMSWAQLLQLLRRVAERRRIVGFDVCELTPTDGPPACSYIAAKLVYKLAAYATLLNPA